MVLPWPGSRACKAPRPAEIRAASNATPIPIFWVAINWVKALRGVSCRFGLTSTRSGCWGGASAEDVAANDAAVTLARVLPGWTAAGAVFATSEGVVAAVGTGAKE